MPRKKKIDDEDDEIIIGYNTKKEINTPPKKKKASKKKKKKNKKKRQNEKAKNKRKNKFKKVLKVVIKLFIVIIIAVIIILFLFVSPVFSVKEITVTGANEISESVYIAMSEIKTGVNIFEVNKINAISNIESEPYVEKVEIESKYPNKIEIIVTERKACYIAEISAKYYYLDKNGYILEESYAPLELPKINGLSSNLESLGLGGRVYDEDLEKFNDLLKIMNAISNNSVNAKLTSIDVSDKNNYILEFTEESKRVVLGQATDLSVKMAWIKLFITDKKEESGTVYLNAKEVYFSPNT